MFLHSFLLFSSTSTVLSIFNLLLFSNPENMNYTEEELNIMEAFEEEMMRIHENPLFYEDDINLDEIEVCNSDFLFLKFVF